MLRWLIILLLAGPATLLASRPVKDESKYQQYQQILRLNNDTVKCKKLITYAKSVVDSLHDFEFALMIFEKAHTLIKDKNYPWIHLRVDYNWGYTYYLHGHYEEADKLFRKALTNPTLKTDMRIRAHILNMAGVNVQHLLVSKRALNYYNEALEIYTRLKDIKLKANVYMNMANVYISAGDFTKANEHLNTAIQLYMNNGMEDEYSILLANKSFIKYKAGETDSARILLIRAMNLHQVKKDKKNIDYITMYSELASYYRDLNNWDSCFYILNRCKYLADSLTLSAQFDGTYYNFMADAYKAKGEADKAVHYYRLALKNKTGITGYRFLFENIASVFQKNKQYDSAFVYMNKALEVTDSIYTSELKEHATFENKRIELLEKDYNDQIESARQQQSMQRLEKKNYVLIVLLLALVICVLLFLVYFRRYSLKVKKEHLQSELDFLKAQLNPHFLFNSINNIYVLMDENKDKASEILLKFSELMRYQLYECNVSTILLSRELQFLENYMEFEKLRYSNKIAVQYSPIQTNTNGLLIAPLLLQPFIENAFKHTPKKKNQLSQISVSISLNGQDLVFSVSNTADADAASELPGGIGLENVKKRLKLLYHGQHLLTITRTDLLYTMTLHLKLNHD